MVKQTQLPRQEALARAKEVLGTRLATASNSTFTPSKVPVLDRWRASRLGGSS